ncbi:saccharopine dehydrogenase NADP-binding domain-containing protein [Glycomyces sp. A-F 0318]|uniref:saccharopine dehydrogenase family protein n=1 Tax=Glycomyces amatae TaxID=2881355 RepID=UPI001E33612C|nr:saccharopine dehydrogenase NADP-binding domain-containing protein [Glycomyces amatae]MCD0445017.1 saccharopine dehydrogenase NADP-binding domain-containing protein [Glycomyces amatae]
MKIAVNGATGYTGKLVAAELVRRGIDLVLIGRDKERLRQARIEAGAEGAELRFADIAVAGAFDGVLDGCDAVVNCAGPFGALGEPVVAAAVAAGCHYVDTTGEQHYVKRVFDRFGDEAARAGVAVVPAMADDGGPGDLLGHLTGAAVSPVAELVFGLWYRGGGGSQGTMRSMLTVLDAAALDYRGGRWAPGAAGPREAMRFPGAEAPVPMAAFGIPPVVTIPRHVRVERAEGFVNADLVARLRAVTPELVESLPQGPAPDARREQRWTHVAEAVGVDGRRARGEVEGSDGYGLTAVIAVEGARRLVADGAPAGVLAPAQAFDAAGFLDWLAPFGVRWRVETG